MSKKSLLLGVIGLILSSWFSLPLGAAEVGGLYEEQIPVRGQSRDERFDVLKQGLTNVLVRITGRSDVAMLPGMDVQIRQASRYLQQYRYRQLAEPVTEPTSGKETSQALWMQFNDRAINQLLNANYLPVWGKNRPAMLIWLVIDDGRQRQLISNDSHHEARQLINSQASARGLPVRLPLLDLTDRANIRVSDVWANFEDTVLAASQRYQAEATLVSRVYRGLSGQWNARYSLYLQGRRQDWESTNETLPGIIRQGIDQSTDFIAQQFAQVVQQLDEQQLLIQVNDINNLAEFNKVQTYLDSLTAITRIQPYRVFADRVIFQLTTRNGRLGVEQAINLGSTLVAGEPPVPVADKPQPENNGTELVYRLIQ